MSYIRFKELSSKLSACTITPQEKKELFALAFGEEYMQSEDKGAKKKYSA